jgi:hypothetical protein
MFADPLFRKATKAAEAFFGSDEFRRVLDGHLAEEYGPLSQAIKHRQKVKDR